MRRLLAALLLGLMLAVPIGATASDFTTAGPRADAADGSFEANLTAAERAAFSGGPAIDFLASQEGFEALYAGHPYYNETLYTRLRIFANAYAVRTGGSAATVGNPSLASAITEIERELFRVFRTGGSGAIGAPETFAPEVSFTTWLHAQGIYHANPEVRSLLAAAAPRVVSRAVSPAVIARLSGYIANLSRNPARNAAKLALYEARLADYLSR